MLLNGVIHIPEEIDSENWVFVAPFADGFAAFGRDEAAAGCANGEVAVCVVGKENAGYGEEGLGEGKGPKQHHGEGSALGMK